MKYIKLLLGLCDHKWKIIREGSIVREDGSRRGNYYELQCEKCGNLKVKNLE